MTISHKIVTLCGSQELSNPKGSKFGTGPTGQSAARSLGSRVSPAQAGFGSDLTQPITLALRAARLGLQNCFAGYLEFLLRPEESGPLIFTALTNIIAMETAYQFSLCLLLVFQPKKYLKPDIFS
ncbi:hypothetical protein PanWU01x14_294450 [Parasponia andersonii]|uniref:Uncharacterized protein n=1 Tax=Parasponia andersonii TaxID=3476 RepID=A0A2P5AWA4_PARAD|nr:hypothetical protein PanWU01x14_294450 [Parasponia andersonii]